MSVIRYVTCKRCKRRFEAPRSDACYCSNACRQAAHRKRINVQSKRLKARTAARREREAALRARTAEKEAAARAFMARSERGEMTPEVFAELKRRERTANLEWAIKTCSEIVERGNRAAATRAKLQVELADTS